MLDLVWLIPALPLAGATMNLCAGWRLGRRAGWVASAAIAAGFVVAVLVLLDMASLPGDERAHAVELFEWISAGSFAVDWTLRVDPLAITMALVVTGVGTLIHLYAVGYMERDPRVGRFFAYFNLFAFFMLMLVLADNYLVLFLGWEGVGLCSYLLIGFWYDRPAASSAAKKAFITTRIGDAAMLVGLVLIWVHTGSLDFDAVFGSAGGLSNSVATTISLLLLAGAVGKSAQLPLHVWLPDAMEGPTPVSALIHAATMVTAGDVLHGLDDESDMRRMGGLRGDMSVSAVWFAIGALALAGIPPLAGFFAKDHIVGFAASSGREAVWVLASVGAFLSALYIARPLFLTFFGQRRNQTNSHEASRAMNAPLAVLAFLSVVGGLVLGLTAEGGRLELFLEPVLGVPEHGEAFIGEVALLTVSVALAFAAGGGGVWV